MDTQEAIKNVKLVGGGLALLSAAGLAYAVSRRLNNRKGYNRPFDSETIEEQEGKIIEISHSNEKKDESRGVYLKLETDQEVIPVHLGPVWYLDHQDGKFKAGEKVEVKGSRINYNGRESIIAMSVIKGNEELKLRDEQGIPLWHGWRKKTG